MLCTGLYALVVFVKSPHSLVPRSFGFLTQTTRAYNPVRRTFYAVNYIDWIRFIDDIFLIWKGDSDYLNAIIEYLNSVVPSIKFTHEISSTSVNFLDTTVMKDSNGNISTDVYQKPTDMHPIGRQHILHT